MIVVIIPVATLEAAHTIRDLFEDGTVTEYAESLIGKFANPVIGMGNQEDLELAARLAFSAKIQDL